MEELLRAIEELKRAYKASGVFNVEVCLWGDNEAVNIVRDDGTEVSQIELAQQKPLTNGEWLRGLSDEELSEWLAENKNDNDWALYSWLRDEHKGVE